MSKIDIINEDIVNSGADFIVQQCNCLTIKSHGLAKTLEDVFLCSPYALRRPIGKRNLSIEEDRGEPGSFSILNTTTKTSIVCLFAQWRPGNPNVSYWNTYPEPPFGPKETYNTRLYWYKQSLIKLSNYLNSLDKISTVAVPYKIGCGLAGGDWNLYYRILEEFTNSTPNAIIKLYKL